MKVALKSTGSTVIEAITYDLETEELIVHFVRGHEHTYQHVHPCLIKAWMDAGSSGQFFNTYIRPLSP